MMANSALGKISCIRAIMGGAPVHPTSSSKLRANCNGRVSGRAFASTMAQIERASNPFISQLPRP